MKIDDLTVTGMSVKDITEKPGGITSGPNDAWQLVALHEILVELRNLNRLLHCRNFIDVPYKLERIANNTAKLERIAKNTTKPKRRRKVKP